MDKPDKDIYPAAATLVAVGILRDAERVLRCRRAADAKFPLYWEFPGGKVESGETPAEALRRELHEELGIVVRTCMPYYTEVADYGSKGRFEVHFFEVFAWEGQPENRCFDSIAWVYPADFGAYAILEGNAEVCRRLQSQDRNIP